MASAKTDMEVDKPEPPKTRIAIRKNNACCVVKDCKSKAKYNPDLSFHRFPKPQERMLNIINKFGRIEEVDKLKAWQDAVQIKRVTQSMTVCSRHFTKFDYILPDYQTKIRRLKSTAVPSLYLPGTKKNRIKKKTKSEITKNTIPLISMIKILPSKEVKQIVDSKLEHSYCLNIDKEFTPNLNRRSVTNNMTLIRIDNTIQTGVKQNLICVDKKISAPNSIAPVRRSIGIQTNISVFK